MSISLIVGKPGDGKSYSAVHMCILPALQQGRALFTNIPINEELARVELSLREDHYIKVVDKETLDKSELQSIPGGTLIVLDEVWRYWKKEERKPDTEDEKFFAEHRHKIGRMPGIDGMLSQDIVIITQNTNEIPTWIKGRVASTYKVVKLNAVGAENRFRVDIYRGAQGERPQKDSFISASFGRYSSEVWRYYQSHTLGDTSGGVASATLEPGAAAKASIWNNTQLRVYFAVAVFAVAFVIYRFGFTERGLFGSPQAHTSPVKIESVPTRSIAAPAVPPSVSPAEVRKDVSPVAVSPSLPVPVPPVPTVSPDWWISGFVHTGEFHKIIITNGQRSRAIKSKESLCEDNGEFRCVFENVAYYAEPIGRRTILPDLTPPSIMGGGAQHRELASNAGAPTFH